jgi:hypothetical protein
MCSLRPLIGGTILLAALLWAAGCKPPATSTKETGGTPTKDDKDHGHPTKGPHGGPLVEWGEEEYHVEFTRDPAKKQATVYILDGEAKEAKPIASTSVTLHIKSVKPPVEIALKADSQKGDPPGSASRFTGSDASLGAEGLLEGVVSGKVGKTPYSGEFKEKTTQYKLDKEK